MLRYNCIIVEDEPLAAEVLTDYIRQVPFLQLVHVCTDALYAMEELQSQQIDLIFLDIHLPKLKGIEFLEALKNPPKVIVTSAYKDYAVDAFDLNVIDYLLKPIRFNRFLKAVNKLNDQKIIAKPAESEIRSPERLYLFLNVGKKKIKVFLDEILYIESLRDYVRITAKDKSVHTKFQISEIEDLLINNNFLRVHRSFIVAKDKITAFTASDIEINNKQIPIGRSYKELVISILERGARNQ
jgi:DNA-binding LytR/AlgR family response regulator